MAELLSLLTDMNRSLGKMNSELTILEELSSQQSLRIVQCNYFNGPSAIEPINFSFMNIRMDNLPVGQNVCFSADALEAHASDQIRRKTQFAGETGVDDD